MIQNVYKRIKWINESSYNINKLNVCWQNQQDFLTELLSRLSLTSSFRLCLSIGSKPKFPAIDKSPRFAATNFCVKTADPHFLGGEAYNHQVSGSFWMRISMWFSSQFNASRKHLARFPGSICTKIPKKPRPKQHHLRRSKWRDLKVRHW